MMVETWGKEEVGLPRSSNEISVLVEDTQVPVQSASYESELPRALGQWAVGSGGVVGLCVGGVKESGEERKCVEEELLHAGVYLGFWNDNCSIQVLLR